MTYHKESGLEQFLSQEYKSHTHNYRHNGDDEAVCIRQVNILPEFIRRTCGCHVCMNGLVRNGIEQDVLMKVLICERIDTCNLVVFNVH